MNIGKIYPIHLNKETAYITGVIVGDGHVSNSCKSKSDQSRDYKIAIEVVDYLFLKEFENLVKSIIRTKSTVKERIDKRGSRKKLYYFQFRNKSLHYFLSNKMKIPAGNKCSSVIVPKRIFDSLELQKYFLAGLFDTDGGIRGKSIGFTSASNSLIAGTSQILRNLKIKHKVECWLNKKYNKQYYGIRIYKRDSDSFLKYLPLRNKEKLEKAFRHVGVPEWSNGIVSLMVKTKN
mgnify:CR=1 FL=1|jgi:hypothetical protein